MKHSNEWAINKFKDQVKKGKSLSSSASRLSLECHKNEPYEDEYLDWRDSVKYNGVDKSVVKPTSNEDMENDSLRLDLDLHNFYLQKKKWTAYNVKLIERIIEDRRIVLQYKEAYTVYLLGAPVEEVDIDRIGLIIEREVDLLEQIIEWLKGDLLILRKDVNTVSDNNEKDITPPKEMSYSLHGVLTYKCKQTTFNQGTTAKKIFDHLATEGGTASERELWKIIEERKGKKEIKFKKILYDVVCQINEKTKVKRMPLQIKHDKKKGKYFFSHEVKIR